MFFLIDSVFKRIAKIKPDKIPAIAPEKILLINGCIIEHLTYIKFGTSLTHKKRKVKYD